MIDEKSLKGFQVEGMATQSQDWRAALTPEVRQKVVNKILANMSNHYQMIKPSSDPEFLTRLTNSAVQFEDRTFRISATKILDCDLQESYVYTIGKKMNSFGPIKSEASKTTGKNSSGLGQTSIANDGGQSSETNAGTRFSQRLVGTNFVEQNMQPNISFNSRREMLGSQSSDQKLKYQLQQQEFQDGILKDKVQNTSKSFVIQPDILNRHPHQRQQHVTSQNTQNQFSQPPSVTTQYRQTPFAQPSNSPMFQQNQQLGKQRDGSEQLQWSIPQQNVLPSFQQPLGQQRDVSRMQLQQKMAGSQPFIFNAQSHRSSSPMIQQPGVSASEQEVHKITQPGQLHQILGSQKQSGLSQEGIQRKPQTSASFHQQRSIADQQKLFQSQISFAGSSSASLEPKSSGQLANTADELDEAYQKDLDRTNDGTLSLYYGLVVCQRFLPLIRISSFPLQLQCFKLQYGPQLKKLYIYFKSLLDKATDPELVRKNMKQVIWIEKAMQVFSLQRNQMKNASKEKLETTKDAIVKYVNLFRQKRVASVEQQAELSLPTSGQSQISQPPQSWNGKLQFPLVNLTMTNGLGNSSPTSSMQSRVPNSQPNFVSSLQYSSGMGLEQKNGPSMFQQSARKTGQNFAGSPQNNNFFSNSNVNAFDSPFTHYTRVLQNPGQQMQKQTIQLKKEQILMRNSQSCATPAIESTEKLHQLRIPTTTNQLYSSSPRKSQLSSAQIDQQNFPSASTPLTPTSRYVALAQVDSQTQSQNQSTATDTPGISASPLLEEFTSPSNASDTNQPFQRLLRAVESMSPGVLSAAVQDIDSVVNMVDKIAGGLAEGHSRAAIGEDLVSETRLCIYEREMEQKFNAMTWDTVGQPMHRKSDFDSTATPKLNNLRIKTNKDLLDEIRRVNQRLVETLVEVDSTEDDSILPESSKGTIIKCSYTAVSLSGDLKSVFISDADYPNTSSVIFDKLPVGCEEPEDLSEKTKLRFSTALRNLSESMSLLEIAKTWDACCRAVLLEFVKPFGGGCFSSRYGKWEDFLTI
ncbi:hypothetical protein POTOM_022468 [Populus tomentosa]|uniref:Mediator complex subunit 15 KIX domain-containing protein n=1 Tax=Populus tomentosa TaxID=118781 RepID=A0A8X7ZNL4_POPTO|nr:hypothetical protein POTOM_022468 [Populus tomentosa]